MGMLDSLLKGGIQGPAGPAGEQGAVLDALASAVPLPDEGLKLFNDPSRGLCFKHADGRTREVAPGTTEDHLLLLSRFVLPGELLAAGTFEAALHAAEDHAYNISTSVKQSPVILLPAGRWTLTQALRVRARTAYAGGTILQGAGFNATILEWPSNYHGRGLWLDGGNGSIAYFYGAVRDLSIHMLGTGCTGIYAEQLVFTQLYNLILRGRNDSAYTLPGRSGSTASCAAAVGGAQVWSGLSGFTEDYVGHEIVVPNAAAGVNNGAFLVTRYISPSSVEVLNEAGVSDGNNGALTWTVRARSVGIVTRGDYTNAQGNSVTNNQNVTVFNVSCEQFQNGWWLESWLAGSIFQGIANQTGGHDVIITHNVELAWKGGMLQSGGTYTILMAPGRAGGTDFSIDSVYHEGPTHPGTFIKSFPPTSGWRAFTCRRIEWTNYDTFADVDTLAHLTIDEPIGYMPAMVVKGRKVDAVNVRGGWVEPYQTLWTDTRSKYDLDAHSFENLNIESKFQSFHAQRPIEASLNRLLMRRGIAGEIWDPRAANKRTVASGDLQALAGMLTGVSMGPQNASHYVTFQPTNANFGGQPTWSNVAGAAAVGGAMKATLNTNIVPVGCKPGLFVVYRLPSASVVAGHRLVLWDDGTTTVYVGAADSNNGGHFGGAWPVNGINIVKPADTLPTACFNGYAFYYPQRRVQLHTFQNNAAAGGYETGTVAAAPGTLTVMGSYLGGIISAAEIAYVAVLKRIPTLAEIELMLDLANNEWELGDRR